MFVQRFYDEADYQRGYLINVFGIFRLLKYKTSKIMEKDKYLIIIEVFGREYIIR